MWGRTQLLGPAWSVLMSVASPAGGSRCTRSGNSLTGSLWHGTGRVSLKGTVGSSGRGWVWGHNAGGQLWHRSPPVRGRMHLSCSFLPSEAAPYLPVEEKSPLFSIQRESLEDGGALYRLNRSVGNLGVLPHAAPVAWCPDPSLPQIQLPAAPRGAPGRSLLCGRPHLGHGVVPDARGCSGRAVRGSVLPQNHGGNSQCGGAAPGPRTAATLGPGHAAGGVSGGEDGTAWGCCVPVVGLLLSSSSVFHGSTYSSADRAGLAYAIAADHGCVWDMKFCPSGAWEPPSSSSKVGVQLALDFPCLCLPKHCLL